MATRLSEQSADMSFLDGPQFRVWPEVLSCPSESSSLNTLKRTSSSLNLKMPFVSRSSLSKDSVRVEASKGKSKTDSSVAIHDLYYRPDRNVYSTSSDEDESGRYLRESRPKSSRNPTKSKKEVNDCKDNLPEPVRSATSNLEYRYSKTSDTKRKKLSKTKSGASVNSSKDKSLGKSKKKTDTSISKTNNENPQVNGTLTKHKSVGGMSRTKNNKTTNFDLTCAEPHVTDSAHRMPSQISNSQSVTDPPGRSELDYPVPSKLSLTESERDIFRTAMSSMKKHTKKEKTVSRVPSNNHNKTTVNSTIKKDLCLEIKSLNLKLASSDNMSPVTMKSKISATMKSGPLHKNEIPKLNLIKSDRDMNAESKSKMGQTVQRTVSKLKTGQQPSKKLLNKADIKTASHTTVNKKSDAGLLKKAAPKVASVQLVSQNANKKSVPKI